MWFRNLANRLARWRRAWRRVLRICDRVALALLVVATFVALISGSFNHHAVMSASHSTAPKAVSGVAPKAMSSATFAGARLILPANPRQSAPPPPASCQLIDKNLNPNDYDGRPLNVQNLSPAEQQVKNDEKKTVIPPGRQGEIDIWNDEQIDGHAIDTVNWVVLNFAFVQRTTVTNCIVLNYEPFFLGIGFLVIVLAIGIVGFHILTSSITDTFRGTGELLVNLFWGISGVIFSSWFAQQFLSLNTALVSGVMQYLGYVTTDAQGKPTTTIDMTAIFNFIGNIGLAYNQYVQDPNPVLRNNNALDPLRYLLSLTFLKTATVIFTSQLLIMRLIFIDVLIIMAPLGLACYMIPQTRKWGRFWLTSFIPTVIEQSLMMLVIIMGITLAASHFLGDNTTANTILQTATYLFVLRVPSLLKDVFDLRDIFVQGPSRADVKKSFDNQYAVYQDPYVQVKDLSILAGTIPRFAFGTPKNIIGAVRNVGVLDGGRGYQRFVAPILLPRGYRRNVNRQQVAQAANLTPTRNAIRQPANITTPTLQATRREYINFEVQYRNLEKALKAAAADRAALTEFERPRAEAEAMRYAAYRRLGGGTQNGLLQLRVTEARVKYEEQSAYGKYARLQVRLQAAKLKRDTVKFQYGQMLSHKFATLQTPAERVKQLNDIRNANANTANANTANANTANANTANANTANANTNEDDLAIEYL